MVDIPTRRRPLALLAIVVVAQVLLLAFQVRRTNRTQSHDVPLIRYWAAELILPIERAGSWMFSGMGGFWSGYIDLRHERAENVRLRAENADLKLRNHELETQTAEAQRMDSLVAFRREHPEAPMIAAQVTASTRAMVAARVIGGSADPVSHTVYVNRGADDGIRRNMAVITPDGIVGKTVEVLPHSAQVQLINDRESGVGAMFAASRTHGIVKGTGDPDPQMDYIVNDEKVHPGDEIITSGDDRIFPKGLAVGVVADNKPASPFQVIHIRTAARLDRLEDVLVLLSQKELNLKSAAENPPTAATNSKAAARSVPEQQHVAIPAASRAQAAVSETKSKAAAPAAALQQHPVVPPASQGQAGAAPAANPKPPQAAPSKQNVPAEQAKPPKPAVPSGQGAPAPKVEKPQVPQN